MMRPYVYSPKYYLAGESSFYMSNLNKVHCILWV